VKRLLPVLLLLAAAPLTAAPAPPNFEIIHLDDLDVLTFELADRYGLTPNIRALRARGVNFRLSAVVNAVCAPSRHAFFTGQYSHNNGLWCNTHDCDQGTRGSVDAVDMPRTIFAALEETHAEGYFGKFINASGSDSEAPSGSPRNPTNVFPQFRGERSTWKGTNDPWTYLSYGTQVNSDGAIVQYGMGAADHQTRLLAGLAAAWITQNRGHRPLFAYYAPVAPHSTGDAGQCPPTGTYSDSYCAFSMPDLRDATWNPAAWQAASSMPFYPGLDPSFNAPSPVSAFADKPALDSLDQQRARGLWRSRFLSMIAVDDAVGQIVAAIGPDAWVVLTSDNGFQHGTHRLGNKQTAFRQSVFVPLVIAGPVCVPGQETPCVVPGYRDQLVLNTDIAVTLAEIAGAAMPWADGRSLVPLLRGESLEWRTVALVEHRKATGAGADLLDFSAFDALLVNRPGLQPRLYVEWASGECELYDDAPQLENTCATSPDVPALHARLQALRTCAGQECRDAEQ